MNKLTSPSYIPPPPPHSNVNIACLSGWLALLLFVPPPAAAACLIHVTPSPTNRCLADLNEIFCAHTHHHAPTTRFPPSGDGVHADTKSGDADLPLDVQRRQTKQARQELQQQQQQRPPTSATCEILRRTSLFASVAALPRRRSFAVKEKERAASGGGGGGLRGAQPRQQVQGRGRGNGLDKETVDDLARISRWALAVRAPTLAEFISADMLLVPGKTWRWLTKEDVLGREI